MPPKRLPPALQRKLYARHSPVLNCPYCSRVFRNLSGLSHHRNSVHPSLSTSKARQSSSPSPDPDPIALFDFEPIEDELGPTNASPPTGYFSKFYST